MLKRIAVALLLFGMVACEYPAPGKPVVVHNTTPSDPTSGNGTFSAALIGTIDGYNVYRAFDGGVRVIYITLPASDKPELLSTSWQEVCGKGCIRNVEVQTNVAQR